MTPPENKGNPGKRGGKPEPETRRGGCQYCDYREETDLRQIVVHGIRYWACEPCQRMAAKLGEADD